MSRLRVHLLAELFLAGGITALLREEGPRTQAHKGPMPKHHDDAFRKILALEAERQQGVHGAGCDLPPDEGLMRDEYNISRRWCRTAANFTMAVLGHDDAVSKNICGRGWWEFKEVKDIGGGIRVRPGQTFLDIGANIGWWTLMFANAGLYVHAFEAMPFNNALIRASFCRNPKLQELVTLHEAALASESRRGAECDIYSHPWNVGDGKLCCSSDSCEFVNNTAYTGIAYEKRATIPMTSMDVLLEGKNLSNVVAMKVDVEGYECEVMKGAWNVVQKYKPKYLLSEVWFGVEGAKEAERGCSGTEYLELLEQYGYIWHRNAFNDRPEKLMTRNLVAAHPEVYKGVKNIYGVHDSGVSEELRKRAMKYRAPPSFRHLRMRTKAGRDHSYDSHRARLLRELRSFTGRGIMIHVNPQAGADDGEENPFVDDPFEVADKKLEEVEAMAGKEILSGSQDLLEANANETLDDLLDAADASQKAASELAGTVEAANDTKDGSEN